MLTAVSLYIYMFCIQLRDQTEHDTYARWNFRQRS